MFCSNCGKETRTESKFCSHCGYQLHASTQRPEVSEEIHHQRELPEYYAPSTLKIIVLSILSLGIYEIYWNYKQWKLVNKFNENKSKDAWGKAIFTLFFCYSLFKQVKQVVTRERIEVGYSPGWLAAGYIIFALTWRAENLAAFLGFLTILFIIPVNNAMKKYLAKEYPRKNRGGNLIKGEVWSLIIGLLIGGFWFWVGWNEELAATNVNQPNSVNEVQSSSANLAGNAYPENVRSNFNKTCLESSEDNTEGCKCLLNYFETNYSFNDYIKLENEYVKTNITPQAFNDATSYCNNQSI